MGSGTSDPPGGHRDAHSQSEQDTFTNLLITSRTQRKQAIRVHSFNLFLHRLLCQVSLVSADDISIRRRVLQIRRLEVEYPRFDGLKLSVHKFFPVK